jgi:hypothetical protein
MTSTGTWIVESSPRMSTGPRDLIPSSDSTGLDAEHVNIWNQVRTDGSATSRGAR